MVNMHKLIPPPVVVAFIGGLMWGISQWLTFGAWSVVWQKVFALVLLVVGVALMVGAAGSFFRVKTTINPMRPAQTTSLVTTGLFGFSRNPIYLGDLLLLIALFFWLGNVINIIFLPLFVWLINRFQIEPEERALSQLFGDTYRDYCKKVRRWV